VIRDWRKGWGIGIKEKNGKGIGEKDGSRGWKTLIGEKVGNRDWRK
jgi:hypothetical protein